jgi:hypothetical protein
MPSVANLPAAVFDVRYAPNSDQILQRSEMTLSANRDIREAAQNSHSSRFAS